MVVHVNTQTVLASPDRVVCRCGLTQDAADGSHHDSGYERGPQAHRRRVREVRRVNVVVKRRSNRLEAGVEHNRESKKIINIGRK